MSAAPNGPGLVCSKVEPFSTRVGYARRRRARRRPTRDSARGRRAAAQILLDRGLDQRLLLVQRGHRGQRADQLARARRRGPGRRATRTRRRRPRAARPSARGRRRAATRPGRSRQRAASSGRPSSSQLAPAPSSSCASASAGSSAQAPAASALAACADRVVEAAGEALGLLGRGARPARRGPASASTTARAEIASTDWAISPARSQMSSAFESSVSAPRQVAAVAQGRRQPEEGVEGDLGAADLLAELVGAAAVPWPASSQSPCRQARTPRIT